MVEKYLLRKYDTNMAFFLQKNWRAGLWNLKFFMKTKEASPEKTSQNNFFHSPALHCENGVWNIQIFFVIFSSCKIFDAVLRLVFNSSPQCYSHPASRLLELQLTFCEFSCCSRLCSTRTQILFKSETAQLAISKKFCQK